jgi:hypothetical protein
MADTKHAALPPVEGDGVSYRAIGWFLVVLVMTIVVSQVLVWGWFRFANAYRSPAATRAPTAVPAGEPRLEGGTVIRGDGVEAGPTLLVREPVVLEAFRAVEEEQLHTYGWIDEATGVVRLPIDRAKALLLERGLPVRVGVSQQADAPAPAQPAAPAPASGTH